MFFFLLSWRVASADEDPSAARAEEIVQKYNARDLGSPGWRVVVLELRSGQGVDRDFTIVNVWRRERRFVDTLFYLNCPKGLRGTAYLLGENQLNGEMTVSLYLPAGRRRVLSIEPNRFSDGLLGSDFGYSDMRMLLPIRLWSYRILGGSRMLDHDSVMIKAVPKEEQSARVSWRAAVIHIARRIPMILGIDYYEDGDIAGPPTRALRVESLQKIDGVWTATRMAMRTKNGKSSRLILKAASFGSAKFDETLFAESALPGAGKHLEPVPELQQTHCSASP